MLLQFFSFFFSFPPSLHLLPSSEEESCLHWICQITACLRFFLFFFILLRSSLGSRSSSAKSSSSSTKNLFFFPSAIMFDFSGGSSSSILHIKLEVLDPLQSINKRQALNSCPFFFSLSSSWELRRRRTKRKKEQEKKDSERTKELRTRIKELVGFRLLLLLRSMWLS